MLIFVGLALPNAIAGFSKEYYRYFKVFQNVWQCQTYEKFELNNTLKSLPAQSCDFSKILLCNRLSGNNPAPSDTYNIIQREKLIKITQLHTTCRTKAHRGEWSAKSLESFNTTGYGRREEFAVIKSIVLCQHHL